MDYEKKYKEALEKAKEFYILCKKCGAKDTIDFLEDSFSELKESDDEKIRKMIINHLMQERGSLSNDEAAEAIAWLEKQGQQKPVEWSEEDEQYLLVCKNALRKYQVTDKWDSEIISQWLDKKIKSIKQRIGG